MLAFEPPGDPGRIKSIQIYLHDTPFVMRIFVAFFGAGNYYSDRHFIG